MSQVLTTCSACIQRPGFIRVLKGNREVWSPCICNASHVDVPCTSCTLCLKRANEEIIRREQAS